MNPAEQIARGLEPLLGSEFDAKAERKARKVLKEAGFDPTRATFSAGAKWRDSPEPRGQDETIKDYRKRIAEFLAQPHPGIANLSVSLSLTVGAVGR
jgi:hypothetical protein